MLLDFQLIEAVVLPMTHKERFDALGIQPPKGKPSLHLILKICLILNQNLWFTQHTFVRFCVLYLLIQYK